MSCILNIFMTIKEWIMKILDYLLIEVSQDTEYQEEIVKNRDKSSPP